VISSSQINPSTNVAAPVSSGLRMFKMGLFGWTLVIAALFVHMIIYNITAADSFKKTKFPDLKAPEHCWDETVFSDIYAVKADKDCEKGDEPVV
jgi:hypothetical protein